MPPGGKKDAPEFRIMKVEDGSRVQTLPLTGRLFYAFAISPDKTTLVYSRWGKLAAQFMDVKTGKPLRN